MKSYKKVLFLSLILLSILLSCSSEKQESLIRITVSLDDESPFNISEIANNIIPIQLELTDESMIGDWRRGYKVFLTDNNIIFLDSSSKSKILLFKRNGDYIRTIGERGQGPREYTSATDVAVDANKQLIYIMSVPKIICYDFKGNFIKEKSLLRFVETANYMNDELLFLETRSAKDGYSNIHETYLHSVNDELDIVDSINLKNRENRYQMIFSPTVCDYLTTTSNETYIYFPDKSSPCDTLFTLVNNKLIPSVEVKFDTSKPFSATDIFKTPRYVIVKYNARDYFCYDTRMDKKYNMKSGIQDDIHSGSKVRIRPNPLNGSEFYYLHDNISDTGEELNPTLYIGKFKD